MSDSVHATDYTMKIDTAPQPAVIETEFGASGIAAGKICINGGTEVEVTEGQSLESVYDALRTAGEVSNIEVVPLEVLKDENGDPILVDGAKQYAVTTIHNADGLGFLTKDYGTDAKIEIYCDNPALADALGLENKNTATGTDSKVELLDGFMPTATVSINGEYVTIKDVDDFEMKFKVAGAAGDVTVSVLDAGPMDLQIGANEGQDIEVRIPRVDIDTLEIANVNVCTQTGAQQAITSYENAINQVSSIRAKLGAYQNRLEHAINSLDVAAENLTESLSRIADTDMAREMAQFTQQQVLSQAGTSMLAQANERPQNVLQLLQS